MLVLGAAASSVVVGKGSGKALSFDVTDAAQILDEVQGAA
jgi:hypothetical protein